MKLFTTIASTLMLALVSQAALAIGEDQIRGEVLSVDASNRSLEVKISEVGDDVTAQTGATETYHVPEDVPIEYDIDNLPYRMDPDFEFSDIQAGDRVLLDFDDVVNRSEVRKLRNEETRNVAARDRIRQHGELADADDDMDSTRERDRFASADTRNNRSSLPDSASNLPLFALLGLAFAGLATALRIYRS